MFFEKTDKLKNCLLNDSQMKIFGKIIQKSTVFESFNKFKIEIFIKFENRIGVSKKNIAINILKA